MRIPAPDSCQSWIRIGKLALLALLAAIGLACRRAEPHERTIEPTQPPGDAGQAPTPSIASPDRLAVLREEDRAWLYERVRGESLATLGPLPGTYGEPVLVRCTVVAWTAPGPLTGARLECTELGAPDGPDGRTWSRFLVFDAAGVRELQDERDVTDRSRTGGITFPRALAGTWTLDEQGAGGRRTQVVVREETAPVRGAPQRLWVAETTRWSPAGAAPDRELVHFLPDLGPVMLCERSDDYACLRLVDDKLASREDVPTMDETVAVDAKLRSTYAPALQRCYRAALAKQPGVRGHLMLHITVNAAGGVEDLSITDAEPGLAACAKAAGAGWRFPIPRGPDGNPRSKTFRIGVMFSTP
jgi:hypothetical protein